MAVYFELFLMSLVPVVISVIFYLLKRKTRFNDLSFMKKQVIIGVVFGLAACLATEFGVNTGDAIINVRDAAPLCAGLIFGAPAGIIAGFIGGIHRWFAVYWSAGMYTRLACSIATTLAGLNAAFLRTYLFKKKRCQWYMGATAAVVMEVLHMTILFMTHLNEPEAAFEIVRAYTLPMMVCNAFSVGVSCLAVDWVSRFFHKEINRDRNKPTIAERVQYGMFIVVITALVLTTMFANALSTGITRSNVDNLLKVNNLDTVEDVEDATSEQLLFTTDNIVKMLDQSGEDCSRFLSYASALYRVTEINVVDENGIIIYSTIPEYVGFDMSSGAQAAEFLVLLDGKTKQYVQSYGKVTFDAKDRSRDRKYAGIVRKYGGFYQVGYNQEEFADCVNEHIVGITGNRHIGNSGYVLIADQNMNIVSDRKDHDYKTMEDIGYDPSNNVYPEGKTFEAVVAGEPCYCRYDQSDGYYVMSVYPVEEALKSRNLELYMNAFMQIIVYTALFLAIYNVISTRVVKDIDSINETLHRITMDNLEERVEVDSTHEIAVMGAQINTTVTHLKELKEEAEVKTEQIREQMQKIEELSADRERILAEEMEKAKKMQHGMLPSLEAFPRKAEFDISASMDTAREVGGDFYDFTMADDNHLAFLVADVSGKGISGAMFMMRSKTIIRNYIESGVGPALIMGGSNDELCSDNEAEMFVTCWMGILDIRTGLITYAVAGHNPPVVMQKDGTCSYMKYKPGMVLGAMEGMPYRQFEYQMQPGDKIYLYTDGVTEAHNMSDELYGEPRLKAYLEDHYSEGTQELLKGVKNDIDLFTGEREQFDDITMLVIEYKGGIG